MNIRKSKVSKNYTIIKKTVDFKDKLLIFADANRIFPDDLYRYIISGPGSC